MTPLKQFQLDKIKKTTLNALMFAAEHVFFTFIVLIFIAAFLGLAVFYKYGFLPQRSEPELSAEIIKFNEGAYQKILAEWQSRGERFEAAKTQKYPDLFK